MNIGVAEQPGDIGRKFGQAYRARGKRRRRFGNHQLLCPLARFFIARRPTELAATVALDRVDDARDRHAAAMRQRLLPHPARQQHEIDRLREEQHHRDRKDELADEAFGPKAQCHAGGPMRRTSQASV